MRRLRLVEYAKIGIGLFILFNFFLKVFYSLVTVHGRLILYQIINAPRWLFDVFMSI